MSEHTEKQISPIKASLLSVKDLLFDADQQKVYLVRTRFEGLINAYIDDMEAISILHLIMSEYTLETRIAIEAKNRSCKRNSTDIQ